MSGIGALSMPAWVEKHLYEPGADIAQMADWPAKVAAIAERCAGAALPRAYPSVAESLRRCW